MLNRQQRVYQYVNMVTEVGQAYSCAEMIGRMCNYVNTVKMTDDNKGFLRQMRYIPNTRQLGILMKRNKCFVNVKSKPVNKWLKVFDTIHLCKVCAKEVKNNTEACNRKCEDGRGCCHHQDCVPDAQENAVGEKE